MADMRGSPTPDEIIRRQSEEVRKHLDLLSDRQLADLFLDVQGEAYDRKLTEEELHELAHDNPEDGQ